MVRFVKILASVLYLNVVLLLWEICAKTTHGALSEALAEMGRPHELIGLCPTRCPNEAAREDISSSVSSWKRAAVTDVTLGHF
ncbi:hypothetical protein QVD17_17665 [Tagetes erecta]|uniref:Secreted protein n=1 Tax=Tagetes erecta TaxID=13708 RepID=A0AAD8KSN6_TARER|nr:hypothetical protein QVD17_17665 [Tagetes erecta]